MTEFKSIVEEWPLWNIKSAPTNISQLSGGLNHAVFKLATEERTLVLKQFKNNQNRIISSIKAQELSSANNLAPAIVYSDPELRYVVMEYFKPSLIQNENLELLGNELRRLHALELPSDHFFTQFDCQDYVQTYWNIIPETIRNELSDLHFKLKQPIQQFDQLKKTSLCHNDLVADNILFNRGDVSFIDWEYAQINSPWFDLASVALMLNLATEQSNKLLSNYWQNTSFSLNNLHTALCAVLWLDVLWSLANNTHSFASIATKIETLNQLLITE